MLMVVSSVHPRSLVTVRVTLYVPKVNETTGVPKDALVFNTSDLNSTPSNCTIEGGDYVCIFPADDNSWPGKILMQVVSNLGTSQFSEQLVMKMVEKEPHMVIAPSPEEAPEEMPEEATEEATETEGEEQSFPRRIFKSDEQICSAPIPFSIMKCLIVGWVKCLTSEQIACLDEDGEDCLQQSQNRCLIKVHLECTQECPALIEKFAPLVPRKSMLMQGEEEKDESDSAEDEQKLESFYGGLVEGNKEPAGVGLLLEPEGGASVEGGGCSLIVQP